MAESHRVPLSDSALEVLGAAASIYDGSGLVFPSPVRPGQPLSDMTLTKILRDNRLADRATVHGFRSSFRIWAEECTSASHAAMELSLAHAVGNGGGAGVYALGPAGAAQDADAAVGRLSPASGSPASGSPRRPESRIDPGKPVIYHFAYGTTFGYAH